MSTVSKRFSEAVEYARAAHDGQVRKGCETPYIYHLLAVSSLVLEYGGNEDQAIAGLLHDVVEDCGAEHEAVIRQRFGDAVAAIVMDCTDGSAEAKSEPANRQQKIASWWERKLAYLAHMQQEPDASLLVGGCDKLHNARAILQDLENPDVGTSVFSRFTAGRDGTLRYYQAIADILTSRRAPMARAFDAVVERMHALAGVEHRQSLTTAIDPPLIRAYLETDYRVFAELPFTLRIGEASAALLAAHHEHDASSSAFLTAANPLGQSTDDAANTTCNDELAARLQSRGLRVQRGIGEHPSNQWPGEDSFLVFGLSLPEACALGRQLQQNALVWSGSDGVPELILLR